MEAWHGPMARGTRSTPPPDVLLQHTGPYQHPTRRAAWLAAAAPPPPPIGAPCTQCLRHGDPMSRRLSTTWGAPPRRRPPPRCGARNRANQRAQQRHEGTKAAGAICAGRCLSSAGRSKGGWRGAEQLVVPEPEQRAPRRAAAGAVRRARRVQLPPQLLQRLLLLG
eukprot:COSAG01_NODE_382_length_17840_cov_68.658663_6_plen_166_part_00